MKILVVRFSSIGDIVLTTPVVRCLKQQLAGVEVHYATKVAYEVLIKDNPYIDKVHLLRDSLNELIAALQKERFDLIVDLHHNLRTQIIATRLGVKRKAFNKLNFEKWLLTNFKYNRLPNRHIVDRYMQTVSHLGVTNDGKGLDYFIPQKDIVDLQIHGLQKNQFVALVIGAKFQTKQLPTKQLVTLVSKVNKPLVLLGGKEDVILAETIETESTNKQLVNLVGQLNLNQSASVLNQSEQVITHDTGLMHIAAALNKTIISVWGNTVPAFGMYPYVPDHQQEIVEVANLSCRPCSKIGYKKCPKGHFKCMNDISTDAIVASLKK